MEKFYEEIHTVYENMEIYGGSFEQALGRALMHADMINAQKIRMTWPELWDKFLNFGK